MTRPTFVLVPGAGGAAEYWRRVVERLAARDLDAVAVALPGDDPEAGLHEYVDEIVRAAHGFDDLVLVGQSIGGFSASLAAPRLPTSRLVLLNAMVPAPGETAGQWWANTGSRDAMRANDVREGRDPDGDFDLTTYFFHDLAPADAELLLADEREETDAIFAAPWDLERWPDVPTRVVIGRDDRFFPADFQRRVARERLGADVEIVEVPGGHLAAMSCPDEVTEALL